MKAVVKYLLFMCISPYILWHCASMSSPSGGPKDIEPPSILSSFPEQGATNISPDQIKIDFDEYFVINNLSNELLISPPLNEKPTFSQKGKSLFVKLEDVLKENTTYTFNFGKGIADLHEKNILLNYSLIFSTGPSLDSLSISGKITPCPERKLPKSILIGLYEKNTSEKDSTIYLKKPDYFGLSNEHGEFSINHIRYSDYEIVAFEDVNSNYKYDESSEKIAFYNHKVKASDNGSYELRMFTENPPLKLFEAKQKNNRLHWAYNQKIDSVKISSDPTINFYHKIQEDSLFIWPLNQPNDSTLFIVTCQERSDSLFFQKDTLKQGKIRIIPPTERYVKATNNYYVETSQPIIEIDTSKMKLISDSVELDFEVNRDNFTLEFEFDHTQEKSFQIIFHKGAIKGLNKSENDSTTLSFYTKSDETLASLIINMNAHHEPHFIELLKNGKVIEKIDAGEQLYFKQLLPAKYELRMTIDVNKDGKWSPGNYFNNVLPEKVYYYSEELNLRANWELEIDWFFNHED